MNIDKAIQIKENDPPMPFPLDRDKIDEADRLSIEALKRLQNIRGIDTSRPINLLPGETKD